MHLASPVDIYCTRKPTSEHCGHPLKERCKIYSSPDFPLPGQEASSYMAIIVNVITILTLAISHCNNGNHRSAPE